MTFAHPAMFVGLAAAIVPLVLHLLHRARYRNVDWGAMMFLDAVEPRQFQGTRLKQWLLLAIRTLMVALLALAMARPVLQAPGRTPPRPGRTAAVFILDCSASMDMNDNGRPRIDLARDALFQLLSPGFHRGDDLWLIKLGATDGPAAPYYTSDPHEMANYAKDLGAPAGQADVADGISQAMALLEHAEAPNRELYIISDWQRCSWRNVDDAFADDLHRKTAQMTRPPRLFFLPVGSREAEHAVITGVRLSRLPAVADQPFDVEVTIRNDSSIPRAAVPLDVQVDTYGKRVHRTVNLPAHGEVTEALPLTLLEAGSHVITASITAPGTPADRKVLYSIDVIQRLNALLVDGDPPDAAAPTSATFLKLSLSPFNNARRNTAVIQSVRQENWDVADLAGKQALILANVAVVTDAQAEAIQQFVWDGGGLIIVPGDQTRADNYNTRLPWLPAVLKPALAEGTASTFLGSADLTHPILRFLNGKPDATPIAVKRYFPAEPRPGAQTLMSYADGKPFLIASTVGRGRVLMFTTPCDTEWNALPLSHFFLPLIQSGVRYTAAGLSVYRENARNLSPGSPLIAEFNEPLDPNDVFVQATQGPRLPQREVGITASPEGTIVACEGKLSPGVYTVHPHGAAKEGQIHYVIRTPPEESDFSPLPETRLSQLEKVMGMQRLDSEHLGPMAAQDLARQGIDLWLPLVGLVIVLAIVELSTARRWAGSAA